MAPCELQMIIIHRDPDRLPFVALSERENKYHMYL